MPVTPDQLVLVMVNDTRQAWEGQWRVERHRLDGTVLADQIAQVSIPAGRQAQMVLEASVAAFGAPPRRSSWPVPTGRVLPGSSTIRLRLWTKLSDRGAGCEYRRDDQYGLASQ